MLSRRGVVALALGVAVLFAAVAASGWQAERNAAALERLRSALADATLLRTLLLAVEDCESGQRGFLLTGQEAYLAPFEAGRAALPGLLGDAGARFAGDAALPALQATAEAKLAEMSRTVDLMRRGARDAAVSVVFSDAGRQQMTRIRDLVSELSRSQQAAAADDMAGIERGGRLLIGIDALALVAVSLVAGVIGLGLGAYMLEVSEARATAARAFQELSRANQHLDDAVRHRTADLTAANEEIQRFAYIVSHDLRAPLVNIMGFTSELEQAAKVLTELPGAAGWPAAAREAAEADIPEALRFIRASTSKMDRLINAILKLSRDGRRTLVTERLDMDALVEGIVGSMRHQAVTKGVEITVAPLPAIESDRIAVEQIFGNLIDNAMKYLLTGRPGQISITAVVEGAEVQYAVADNGRGIAPQDHGRIFELFRRSGAQDVPGEGIGLTHVRALVRRLGGQIACTSALGAGTTFTVTLPRCGTPGRE